MRDWHDAMELRRRHFGYTKRLPPRPPPPAPEEGGTVRRNDHYAWATIGDLVTSAVAERLAREKNRVAMARPKDPKPLPRAITSERSWAKM